MTQLNILISKMIKDHINEREGEIKKENSITEFTYVLVAMSLRPSLYYISLN